MKSPSRDDVNITRHDVGYNIVNELFVTSRRVNKHGDVACCIKLISLSCRNVRTSCHDFDYCIENTSLSRSDVITSRRDVDCTSHMLQRRNVAS